MRILKKYFSYYYGVLIWNKNKDLNSIFLKQIKISNNFNIFFVCSNFKIKFFENIFCLIYIKKIKISQKLKNLKYVINFSYIYY